MSNSLLVVFTGGTISSRLDETSIDVIPGHTRLLLNQYEASSGVSLSCDTIEPFNVLSENIEPMHWDILHHSIRAAKGLCRGVVVTHGTDSLHYTASALSFALADLDIPIVLVSSDKPIEDPSSNGLTNFADALRVIDQGVSGVFVTYQNPDGRRLVHIGSRLVGARPLVHHFASIAESHCAEISDSGKVLWRGEQLGPRPPKGVIGNRETRDSLFGSRVKFMQPYPGLDYGRLDLSDAEAVVHDLYHSGTACVSPHNGGLSILHLARGCEANGIPLFLVPWSSEMALYQSANELLHTNVCQVQRMASTTAYVKVLYGLGLGFRGQDLCHFVAHEDCANEFVPESGAVTTPRK